MSRGVNKVILIGLLGKDPEARSMPSGNAVSNFSIATSETFKDSKSGEKREVTEWHNIVAFNRLAEVCNQYLQKGSKVYIEGKIKTRSWEKDGTKHYMTEIVVSEIQFLDSKGDNDNSKPQRKYSRSSPSDSAPSNPPTDDFDDSISF